MTLANSLKEALEIRRECIEIHNWLWEHGWDVTLDRVIKHHKWFRRWWHRELSFGYVINRVGIKRREE